MFLDKPGKPGKPEVEDSDKKQITIKWDKPKSDGGDPIQGYNVERKDPRTGRWNKINKEPIEVCCSGGIPLGNICDVSEINLYPGYVQGKKH